MTAVKVAAFKISFRGLIKRVIFMSLCFGIGLTLIAQQASAQNLPSEIEYDVFSARDQHNGAKLEITMERGKITDIKAMSPSTMRREFDDEFEKMRAQCHAKPGVIKSTLRQFPAEAAAFSLALGVGATLQIQGDPAALLNFYNQSLVDPLAHVSFLGFMLANRMTAKMLTSLGLNFDPCEVIKRTPPGARRPHLQPTRMQQKFMPLVGPLGMTAGMMVSSILHEVLVDKNVHLCIKGMVSIPKSKEAQTQIDQACDVAYEDWAVSRKITQYAPNLMSMLMAAAIQGYVVNKGIAYGVNQVKSKMLSAGVNLKAKASHNAVEKVVFRSLQVSYFVGKNAFGGPAGRFVLTLGNFAIFLGMDHLLNDALVRPFVAEPLTRWKDGTDITKQITDIESELSRVKKNGWVWKPKDPTPECAAALAREGVDNHARLVPNADKIRCEAQKSRTISELLGTLGRRQTDWRQFLVQDASAKHASWQTYVTNFTNMYSSAFFFYQHVLDGLQAKRKNPSEAIPLFMATPFNGINITIPDHICAMDESSQERFARAASLLRRDLQTLEARPHGKGTVQADWMRQTLQGLDAANCSKPLHEIQIGLRNTGADGADLSTEEKVELEDQVRRRYLKHAVSTLHKALQDTQKKSYSPTLRPHEKTELETWLNKNAFYRVAKVIGTPEPVPNGVAYIRALNNEQSVIQNQEMKDVHPSFLRRARTDSMTDYLLASMVCGPEANPSNEAIVRLAREKKRSTFDKALSFFGMGSDVMSEPFTEEELSDALIVFEEEITPEPRFLNFSKHRTVDVSLLSKLKGVKADFRPPRVIEDIGMNLCNHFPKDGDGKDLLFDIHKTSWNINGKTYRGFWDIVQNFARPSIVGDAYPTTTQWWFNTIEGSVQNAVTMLRDTYEEDIVKQSYVPRISNNETKVYNGKTFALGVAASLNNEVGFHLALLKETLRASGAKSNAKISEELNSRMRWLKYRFDLGARLISDREKLEAAVARVETHEAEKQSKERGEAINTPQITITTEDIPYYGTLRVREAYNVNREDLQAHYTRISELVQASQGSLTKNQAALQTVTEIQAASLLRLGELMTELDNYAGIVNAVTMDGMD